MRVPPDPADFADLDALAAKGDGRLWLCAAAGVWSYAACPTTTAGGVPFPVEAVPDARVRAALATGAWAVALLDTLASPPAILAVARTPEASVAGGVSGAGCSAAAA